MPFSFPTAVYTPPSVGAAKWGLIPGSLEEQQDLKAAFDQVQGELDAAETRVINNRSEGTDYVLVTSDNNKNVAPSTGSNTEVQVPLDDDDEIFPMGAFITITRLGSGEVDVVGEAGVSVLSADNKARLQLQYSVAYLHKVATNQWILSGDLIAIPV